MEISYFEFEEWGKKQKNIPDNREAKAGRTDGGAMKEGWRERDSLLLRYVFYNDVVLSRWKRSYVTNLNF